MFSELVEALKRLPTPYRTWIKIEKDLLDFSLISGLGAEETIAGTVISLIPESDRNNHLDSALRVAKAAIAVYERYGNSDIFNHNRLSLRASLRGYLI